MLDDQASKRRPAPAGDDAVAAKKKTARRRRPQTKNKKRLVAEAAKNVSYTPDKVRTVYEWCSINGFSLDTGYRILAGKNGPKVLQLSAKRIGIRDSDNREWQDSLVRGGK